MDYHVSPICCRTYLVDIQSIGWYDWVMKVFELISNQSSWCDDAFAKDAMGNKVYWKSELAVQFDFMGAIHHCYSGQDLYAIYGYVYSKPEMADGNCFVWYSSRWGWQGCYEFAKKYNF